MAGIEAGKTWSRIGAEVAPTSSAASGVWGDLNEVAENVGAGTWPAPQAAYQFIAKVGPMDGTTTSVSFTSVPQTYRHLRLVVSGARRTTYTDGIYINFNSSASVSDYGWQVMYQSTPGGGPAGSANWGSWPPYGDFPDNTNSSSGVWDFGNYSDASVGTSIQWAWGADVFNGGLQQIGASNWVTAAAVTQIDLISNNTTANYLLEAPTTVSLFGIGTS